MSVAAFMHYAIADGSRTPTGFGRLIFTHAVLKPLEIRQYSLQALPCLSKNQLCQNCKAPVGVNFQVIFVFLRYRWADAH